MAFNGNISTAPPAVADAYTVTNNPALLRSMDAVTGTPQQIEQLLTTILSDLATAGYFTNVTIT